ncbi:TPA: hypothetical protein TZN77_000038 [Streptococcus suis]|nr:hypothetical protein [Streptococcus suis]HEM2719763.1 hypothetical protein [Streptococcus suis]
MLNKLKNNRRNLQEVLITSLGQFLYLFQGLIQNKIFASYFETSVFGQWALLSSAYVFISMLPFTALEQGIYKEAIPARKNGQDRQLYSLIAVVYSICFSIYTVVLVFLNIIQGESFFADGYIFLFLFYAFTEIFKNTYLVLDNAYRYRKRVLLIRLLDLLSRIIPYLLLFQIGLFSIKAVLIVLCLSNLLVLVFQRNYIKEIRLPIDKIATKEIFQNIVKFSAPLMVWAIFGWLQNMIGRWYLDMFLDLEAVAAYTILTSLSYFVPNMVYTVCNAYIMPLVFSRTEKLTRTELGKYLSILLGFFAVYFISIVLLGRWLIILLADPKYLSILGYLPITTLSAILYVLAMSSTIEIYRRGETRKLLVSSIVPGAAMATIGFILIKELHFQGVVINYVMGHIVYTVLTAIVVIRNID